MCDGKKGIFNVTNLICRLLVGGKNEGGEVSVGEERAFSLAEAMITLLLVSIILAAVAPVMSKRMKLSQTGFSTQGQKKTVTLTSANCTNHPSPEDILKGEAFCSGEFEVPEGVTELTLTMVGGGGGGGSALTSGEYEWTLSGSKIFNVPIGINQIESTLVSGGAGGGAGNILADFDTPVCGANEFKVMHGSDEVAFVGNGLTQILSGGATSISEDGVTYYKNLCVKKRNVGGAQPGEIPVAAGTTVVPIGASCSGGNCCWRGQTADVLNCDSNTTSYSGCTRTLCTWAATHNACSALGNGWRMPALSEFQKWRVDPGSTSALIASYRGGSGLDLCQQGLQVTSAQCLHYINSCLNPAPVSGFGYHYWTDTPTKAGYYYIPKLILDRLSTDQEGSTNAPISGRCVQTQSPIISPGNGASGGGGGAVVQSQLIQVMPSDELTVVVGAGGKGGKAGSNDSLGALTLSKEGTDAMTTRVTSKMKGTLLNTNWMSSKPDNSSTSNGGPHRGTPRGLVHSNGTSFGKEGGINDGKGTYLKSANSWAKAADNFYTPGVVGSLEPGTIGGDGGITPLDGVTVNTNGTGDALHSNYSQLPSGWCKVAKGGISSSKDGKNVAGFGGCGGAGGYGLGAGGDGALGYARLRWNHEKMAKYTVKGAGGGGGAGQSIVKYQIKNIPTSAGGKTKIKYTIGLGGIGGTITTASTSGRAGGTTTFGNLKTGGGLGGGTIDVSKPIEITNGNGGEAGTLCQFAETKLNTQICKVGKPGEDGSLKTAGIGGQGGFSYFGNEDDSGAGGFGADVKVFVKRDENTIPNNQQGAKGKDGKIIIEWY